MSYALLPDRAIVSVTGEEDEALLNRLVTNSMLAMRSGEARYAALLSPQGKLLFDFLACRSYEGFWLDCRRDQAADLARKLTLFRLRASVEIAVAADLAVAAAWGGDLLEAPGPCFRDPRHADLGWRIVAPWDKLDMPDRGSSAEAPRPSATASAVGNGAAAYRAHAIALGVPEGGIDWPYGDTFVHDANLDLLHGVDFGKGCYVGQEVVSRVHHRGSARKRIVSLRFLGDPPPVGSELLAATTRIGVLTSLAGRQGLATARIDRLEEAAAAGAALTAGDTLVEVGLPATGPSGSP